MSLQGRAAREANAFCSPMLICTLLTFALCADPNVPAAMSIGDLTVPIVWSRATLRSCMDSGSQYAGGPGDARLAYETGPHGAVRISSASISLTAYTWPKMDDRDRAAMRLQYRATLWHEIGHIVTGRTSLAAVTARGLAPMDAFQQMNKDQRDYENLTNHGIDQHLAPPPLAGADTIVDCGVAIR